MLALLLQLLQPADIALLPSGFKTLGEWVPNLLALLLQNTAWQAVLLVVLWLVYIYIYTHLIYLIC